MKRWPKSALPVGEVPAPTGESAATPIGECAAPIGERAATPMGEKAAATPCGETAAPMGEVETAALLGGPGGTDTRVPLASLAMSIGVVLGVTPERGVVDVYDGVSPTHRGELRREESTLFCSWSAAFVFVSADSWTALCCVSATWASSVDDRISA
mmetsp:Transcript_17626/g.40959  ORF Transcript_17626/g.40959 Transcript_17626/m.40959 type:complete len:156 (-) Transcript_17626:708-1175(-)